MVDRSGPGRDVGKDDRPVGVGEELVVAACSLSALLVPLRQMSKFRAQYTCLDGIESAVVPFDVVEVFLRLAVVAEHLAAPRQSLVVGGDGTRFAAGTQILAGVEAERRGMTHYSGLAPAVLLLREVLCAVRLAGVLDDDQVIPGRQLEDGVHVGHLPVQVYGDDGRHWAATALAHYAARLRIWCAFGLQIGAQLLRIHGVGALIDVDEIRPRARLRDCLRGGDEGERHRHHGISWSDARRDQREAQGVGAAGHSHAELRLTERREVALELLDCRATNEPGGVERGVENRAQLFPELAVNSDKIEKRNLTFAHWVLLIR